MIFKKRMAALLVPLCLIGLVACNGSSGNTSDGGASGKGSSSGNKAPVARVEQTEIKGRVGNPVYLSADASMDADNDTLSYLWALESTPPGSTAQLNDTTAPNPSFEPDKYGMYRFKVVVSDGKDESAPVYVIVTTGFTGGTGLEFVEIGPGTFTMGSPADEPGRKPCEVAHEVTLTKGFYMMTTEVTNKLWQTADGSEWTPPPPAFPVTSGSDYPVSGMYKASVSSFLQKLNARGEGVFRLPTEAEWEYAARAESTGAFANSNPSELDLDVLVRDLDEMGWCITNGPGEKRIVAQKQPNAWGLYDMHGNVMELCSDHWDGTTAYAEDAVTDPSGDDPGTPVVRGGSHNLSPTDCRSAARLLAQDGSSNSHYAKVIGLRLVRELETPPVANPGLDRTSLLGETITLDGSASYDPDTYDITFQWTLISAPDANTAEIRTPNASIAAFSPNAAGYHVFELTVDDGHSAPVSRRVTIDVQVISKLVLFEVPIPPITGNMGGRAGADKLVADNYWLPGNALQIHAFLSVTEDDCIKNMPRTWHFPTNLPVYASDGVTKVAENWADLLDGSLPGTLEDLGVDTRTNYWWSGSKPDGTLAESCNGWTEESGNFMGSYGSLRTTDGSWMGFDTPIPSYESLALLGIAVYSRSVHKPRVIRLFSTKEEHMANAGGREGINEICRKDPNHPGGLPNTFGFVTVNHVDCIKNMPDNFGIPADVPVTGPDGVSVIADNWADLLDGDIKMTLLDAGLLRDTWPDPVWWSGSEPDGTMDRRNYTAAGWTSMNEGERGTFGDENATGGNWLNGGNGLATDQDIHRNHFLGISY